MTFSFVELQDISTVIYITFTVVVLDLQMLVGRHPLFDAETQGYTACAACFLCSISGESLLRKYCGNT